MTRAVTRALTPSASRPGHRGVAMTAVASAALALLAGCSGSREPSGSGGLGTAGGPPSAQTFTLHGNDQRQFVPQTVQAKVGTLTLTLQNGGVPHNVTFKQSGLPGISAVSGSATKSVVLVFSTPGTYDFECTIHPGMDGKVVVTR